MNIVRNINLRDITANPYQPRTVFDKEKLEDLAKSLKEDGMIEPVVLRKINGGYEIVAGERRCRAAELAGLNSVPAMIISADDSTSARLALIENIQREDLNAIEEAIAFSNLLEIEGCTQEDLAKRLGKSQSTIANKIRLLNLNQDVKDGLINGEITERQARALLQVTPDKQSILFNEIKALSLDSAKTEDYLKTIIKKKSPRIKSKKNKVFIRDARIAVNTIDSAVKSIKNTNLSINKEVIENEDEYTFIIHIKKI